MSRATKRVMVRATLAAVGLCTGLCAGVSWAQPAPAVSGAPAAPPAPVAPSPPFSPTPRPDPTSPTRAQAVRALQVWPAKETVPRLRNTLRTREMETLAGNSAMDLMRVASLVPAKPDPQDRISTLRNLVQDPATHEEIRQVLREQLDPVWPMLLDACRRDSTRWDNTGIRMDMALPELAKFRHIARVLMLRGAFALAEKRFDDATETARVMLELGQRVGEGNLLIQRLVGVAIGALGLELVMLNALEPGSPNMYWALTDLRSPMVDMVPAIRYELSYLDRAVPELRDIESGRLSPESAGSVWVRVLEIQSQATSIPGATASRTQGQLAGAGATALLFPQAAAWMRAQGQTQEEIEALPASYVTLRYAIATHREKTDKLLSVLSLPSEEAQRVLTTMESDRPSRFNPMAMISDILRPTISRPMQSQTQIQRQVAMLRVAELLRLHAATTGSLPASLAEITVAPVPKNPANGREFLYTLKDGVAIICTEPPPQPAPGQDPDLADTRPYFSELRVTLRRE